MLNWSSLNMPFFACLLYEYRTIVTVTMKSTGFRECVGHNNRSHSKEAFKHTQCTSELRYFFIYINIQSIIHPRTKGAHTPILLYINFTLALLRSLLRGGHTHTYLCLCSFHRWSGRFSLLAEWKVICFVISAVSHLTRSRIADSSARSQNLELCVCRERERGGGHPQQQQQPLWGRPGATTSPKTAAEKKNYRKKRYCGRKEKSNNNQGMKEFAADNECLCLPICIILLSVLLFACRQTYTPVLITCAASANANTVWLWLSLPLFFGCKSHLFL